MTTYNWSNAGAVGGRTGKLGWAWSGGNMIGTWIRESRSHVGRVKSNQIFYERTVTKTTQWSSWKTLESNTITKEEYDEKEYIRKHGY